MKWIEKNIEKLRERKELDYHKICEYMETYEEKQKFFVESARDGIQILGMYRENKKILLNSSYRPLQEAEKYSKKIPYTQNALITFFGLGNGIILREIVSHLNEEAQVYVYEPSKELFAFSLKYFDLSDLLEDKRIHFFVQGINEKMYNLTLYYCMEYVNIGVASLEAHPKYTELFVEDYENVLQEYKDCRNSALVNMRTAVEKSEIMTKNAILNIPFMLSSRIAGDFERAFPDDMPAILVSGGPSLDKNYELLKEAKGKAYIIAVDRTAKYLLDRGIEPDLFCSLDFRKSVKLFMDERLQKIPFLYIAELNTNVLRTLGKENLLFGTTDMKFCNWMIEKCGKYGVALPIGGSVATLGFSFARMMGFHRLIMVGQDLALTGGEVYAGGMKNKVKEAEEFETLEVAGNVEETVLTRGDYYVYLKWFEQAVKEASEDSRNRMEVINATEGGAKIDGTIVMSLEEAIDRFCVSSYDVRSIFESKPRLANGERLQEMWKLLFEKEKSLYKFKDKAKEAAECARRLGILASRNDFEKEFKKKNKILADITDLFDDSAEASVLSRYAEGMLIEEDMDLYASAEDENIDEMIRLYEKIEKNYQYIYDKADEAIALYLEMMDRMREEYGELLE